MSALGFVGGLTAAAHAQTPPSETGAEASIGQSAQTPMVKAAATELATVLVIGSPPLAVGGWGGAAARELPQSSTVISSAQLRDMGSPRASQALHSDPSVSDSYNAPAYWDSVAVRGYTLDNRSNWRREGMPISAETMIPMDNKDRMELIKGTSGLQSGVSSPAGLVNLSVKRPPSSEAQALQEVTLQSQAGNRLGAVDIGHRFGTEEAGGYRLNAAYEHLNPQVEGTQGHRQLAAVALDWRMSENQRWDLEWERSQRMQKGAIGQSLWGDQLPPTINTRQNLSQQPWSQPAVFDGNTGSIRYRQNFNDWQWTTQAAWQHLRTDDRLAFAYGCGSQGVYDRYCSDGRYDLYDYRSDKEQRRTQALQTQLMGTLAWGQWSHHIAIGLQWHRQTDRLPEQQANNLVAADHAYGDLTSTPNPTPNTYNTNRTEGAKELWFSDSIEVSPQEQIWLGLRYTQSERRSASLNPAAPNVQTDVQSFATPWLGWSRQWSVSGPILYASYGQGVELPAAPNNALYANAGQVLAAQRSHQAEIGLRSSNRAERSVESLSWTWQLAAFRINRPLSYDILDGSTNLNTRVVDGVQRHQGLEFDSQWQWGVWQWGLQGAWLHARMHGVAQQSSYNGQEPVNVPAQRLRAQAQYRLTEWPTLRAQLQMEYESSRRVTQDGTVRLPAWMVWHAAVHHDQRWGWAQAQWTVAIENLANRSYWRESPLQFGHTYLYVGAPRTLRLQLRLGL